MSDMDIVITTDTTDVNRDLTKLEKMLYSIGDRAQFMGTKINKSFGTVATSATKAKTAVTNLGKSVTKLSKDLEPMAKHAKTAFGWSTATAIAGVTALGVAMTNLTQKATELNRLSLATGLSTDSLQEWDYALKTVGKSIEQFDDAFFQMHQTIADAQNGDKRAVQTFRQLGVSLTNAKGQAKDMNDVLKESAIALSKIGNTSVRSKVTMQTFGEEGGKAMSALTGMGPQRLQQTLDRGKSTAIPSATLRDFTNMRSSLTTLNATLLNKSAPWMGAVANFINGGAKILTDKLSSISTVSRDEANERTRKGIIALVSGFATIWNNTIGGLFDFLNKQSARMELLIGGVASTILASLVSINTSLGALSIVAGAVTAIVDLIPIATSYLGSMNPFANAGQRAIAGAKLDEIVVSSVERNLSKLKGTIDDYNKVLERQDLTAEERSDINKELLKLEKQRVQTERELSQARGTASSVTVGEKSKKQLKDEKNRAQYMSDLAFYKTQKDDKYVLYAQNARREIARLDDEIAKEAGTAMQTGRKAQILLSANWANLVTVASGGIAGVGKIVGNRYASKSAKNGRIADEDLLPDEKIVYKTTTADKIEGVTSAASTIGRYGVLVRQIFNVLSGLDNMFGNIEASITKIDPKKLEDIINQAFKNGIMNDVVNGGGTTGGGIGGGVDKNIGTPWESSAEYTRATAMTEAYFGLITTLANSATIDLNNISMTPSSFNYGNIENPNIFGMGNNILNNGFKTPLLTQGKNALEEPIAKEESTTLLGRLFGVTGDNEIEATKTLDLAKTAMTTAFDMFSSFSDLRMQKAQQEADHYRELEYEKLDNMVMTQRGREREQKRIDAEAEKRRKEGMKGIKALQIAQIAMSTATSIGSMWASVFSTPKPITAQLSIGAGITGMLLANSVAQIAQVSQQNFTNGGVVGGNSYTGDKIQAGLNTDEMVLNRRHITTLFKAIDSGNVGSQPSVYIENFSGNDEDMRRFEDMWNSLKTNGRV